MDATTDSAPASAIWISGNSKAARRRVVQYGQGWCPVIGPAAMASSSRTETIDTVESFGQAVTRLRSELAAAERDPAGVEIQVEVPRIDFGNDGVVRNAIDDLADLENYCAT